jgi:hypothetical protein
MRSESSGSLTAFTGVIKVNQSLLRGVLRYGYDIVVPAAIARALEGPDLAHLVIEEIKG